MKLFAKFFAFVLLIVGLVWAKKHFLDKPAVEATAVETRSAGGAIATQPPAATPTSAPDQNKIASLLSSVFHGGNAAPQDKARIRMNAFMQAWKDGGTSLNDAEQAASCLWSRGKMFIPDRDEIQDAYNGFVQFRKYKDLYTAIKSYEIADPVERGHDAVRGGYTIFAVTINGVRHQMGVPDKANPIFWLR